MEKDSENISCSRFLNQEYGEIKKQLSLLGSFAEASSSDLEVLSDKVEYLENEQLHFRRELYSLWLINALLLVIFLAKFSGAWKAPKRLLSFINDRLNDLIKKNSVVRTKSTVTQSEPLFRSTSSSKAQAITQVSGRSLEYADKSFGKSNIASEPDISPEYEELLITYNNNIESLERKAVKVSETTESLQLLHLKGYTLPILEKGARGNYWLVISKNVSYLFPSKDLMINTYNSRVVEALFVCTGCRPETSNKGFQVKKPAIMIPYGSEKWKLSERGLLQFA